MQRSGANTVTLVGEDLAELAQRERDPSLISQRPAHLEAFLQQQSRPGVRRLVLRL